MLLNNFAYQLSGSFVRSFTTHLVKNTIGEISTSDYDEEFPAGSSSFNMVVDKTTYTSSSASNGTRVWAFAFGTGDTPPTVEDYKLSGELIENLVMVANSGKIVARATGVSFYATIVNNSEAEVTIKEMALCSSTTNNQGCIMLTRDVLAEPLVLKVGEQKILQIDINVLGMLQNAE